MFLFLFYISLSVESAEINTANVHFTGNVYDTACNVAPDSVDKVIPLGFMYNVDLQKPNDASDWKNFSINLIDCPSSTSTVNVSFVGTPDQDNTDFYMNTGDADNVSVELESSSGDILKNGYTKSIAINPSTHAASVDMRTRAVTIKGSAEVGFITTVIQLNFTYQ